MIKGRIKTAAFIGWKSIDFEQISLDDETLTALLGPNGAGKSSLIMCLNYALLPDKKILDIRPISDVKDPHSAGVDVIADLIDTNYGYAYVVLDILTRQEGRLIAGIHVSVSDGRAEFKRWIIENSPREMPLKELMRAEEAGDLEYFPDIGELTKKLSQQGIDLKILKKVGEYGQALYAAGVLPTDLVANSDRQLYGKLIETTFKGGISSEVAARLRDYLLPEAARIPETITKLQECTDQVLRTRMAARDADKQLAILDTVLGNGKKVIIAALARVTQKISDGREKIGILKAMLSENTAAVEAAEKKLPELDKEIKTTQETENTVKGNKEAERSLLVEQILQLAKDETAAKLHEETVYQRYTQLTNGRKKWASVAGVYADKDHSWLLEWLKSERKRMGRELHDIDANIENLQKEKNALSGVSDDKRTMALAGLLESRTLEETYKNVTETEATAIEMSLNGLIAGVVGTTPEALTEITPSEMLPDLFWVGDKAPSAQAPKVIGEWLVVPHGGGGFTVASRQRQAILGEEARARRRSQIEVEISQMLARKKAKDEEEQKTTDLEHDAVKNEDIIRFYLDNKLNEDSMKRDWITAQGHKDSASRELQIARQRQKRLDKELSDVTRPYQEEIVRLKVQRNEIEARITELREEIEEDGNLLADRTAETDVLGRKLLNMQAALGLHYDEFLEAAGGADREDDSVYMVEQTKRILDIQRVLEAQSSWRTATDQETAAGDEVSCAKLWPRLYNLMAEQIPSEVLDVAGDDILKGMRERRSKLNADLALYENEVKIEATNIHVHIHTEINNKKQKIRRLGRFGESLKFGNITGVRVSVQVHQSMLKALESFADQLLMFSDRSRPVDMALADYFSTQMDLKMDGKSLLDYRTYMDLYIEVRRMRNDWERVTTLSGGESIGCGLAIVLMLVRSLSARGELKPEQITPLFAIDEILRLDSAGMKTVIEFGKREGFQLIVTAQKLDTEQEYPCTLYGLVRKNDRLIIRKIRLSDQEAATA